MCVMVGPKGGAPKGGARIVGPRKVGSKISCFFFPSPTTSFALFVSHCVYSRCFLVFGKRRGRQMCTFGVLGLSCGAPAAPYAAVRVVPAEATVWARHPWLFTPPSKQSRHCAWPRSVCWTGVLLACTTNTVDVLSFPGPPSLSERALRRFLFNVLSVSFSFL